MPCRITLVRAGPSSLPPSLFSHFLLSIFVSSERAYRLTYHLSFPPSLPSYHLRQPRPGRVCVEDLPQGAAPRRRRAEQVGREGRREGGSTGGEGKGMGTIDEGVVSSEYICVSFLILIPTFPPSLPPTLPPSRGEVSDWEALVWRQWTVGDVVQILNSHPTPTSVMPEQPPELAFYMENAGVPVWDYTKGRYDLIPPFLPRFWPQSMKYCPRAMPLTVLSCVACTTVCLKASNRLALTIFPNPSLTPSPPTR